MWRGHNVVLDLFAIEYRYDKITLLRKNEPGEIFIRRYSRAEREEAIEVEGRPEEGGPRRYRRAEIERGEAKSIQETVISRGAVRPR